MILLSTAYFPNIQYISFVYNSQKIVIDIDEIFIKQTLRNRCNIQSANGILPLVVPVLHGRSGKIKTKDIKICYDDNWQHRHYQSIKSAYSSSPFFEYYFPEIEIIFNKNFIFLFELNFSILELLNKILKLHKTIEISENLDITQNNFKDNQSIVSIKNNTIDFIPKTYFQVFLDRYKFMSNLSILDLIFNVGNQTKDFLNI